MVNDQPDQPEDPEILTKIDRVANAFESSWNLEKKCSLIRQCVRDNQDVPSDRLIRELVALEVELRVKQGERPSKDEYLERFSELDENWLKQLIEEVSTSFSESASDEDGQATIPPERDSDDEDATLPPENSVKSRSNSPALSDFGDYEIIEEIARGGMGVVYKARQAKLNRIVALKMILAGQLAGEEDIERFKSEATAAANLDHIGIVPIYEIGDLDGQHYFSMGFVEGESLADRVADGPLGVRDAAELTKLIAEAVAFAHEKGVIHRDLKPANVLIDASGEPKVTDFGLAKHHGSDSNLTRTGAVMGTPSYMPPEQAAGQEVGPLADVYSIGAILYCLLTARPPFQAATAIDTLMQVIEQNPVPPTKLNALVDRDLDTICLKCLQKETHLRYQSAQDLADDLQRFLNGEPIKARPASVLERSVKWIKRRPVISGLAGLVLIVFTVGLTGIIWNWREAVFQFSRAEASLAKEKEARDYADERRRAAEEAEAKQKKLRGEAELATKKANEAKASETEAKQKAIQARKRAEQDRDAKEAALVDAKGLALTAQSTSVRESDPALSLLLAIESVKQNPTRMTFANLYDAREASREILTLRHNAIVTSIAASADGSVIATAGQNECRFSIWDTKTGRLKWKSPYFGLSMASIDISSDGHKVAATVTGDLPSYLVSSESNNEVTNFLKGLIGDKPPKKITHLTDRMVRVWDIGKRQELFRLIGHEDRVTCVKFAQDGDLIFTSSWDRTIRMWDGKTGKELKKWQDIDGRPIRSIDVDNDGKTIVVVPEFNPYKSVYFTEKLKDKSRIDPDEPMPKVVGRGNINLSQISVPKTGRSPAIFYLINTEAKEGDNEIYYLRNQEVTSTCVAMDDQAESVAIGCRNGKAFVYQKENWAKPMSVLEGHSNDIRAIEFSNDGSRVVTCGSDESVRVWDSVSGKELFRLRGHSGFCNDVAFGPNAESVYSAGDFTGRIWDLRSIPPLAAKIGSHSRKVLSVSFDSSGKKLNSISLDGTNYVWDVASNQKLLELTDDGKRNSAQWGHFSFNGRRVLTNGVGHNSLRIWNLDHELDPLKFGNDRGTAQAAMSPDGRRVVSVSNAVQTKLIRNGQGVNSNTDFKDNVGFVRIWNSQTGAMVAELPKRTHPAYQPQVSHDSKWSVIPLHDEDTKNEKAVHIIDLKTGKSLRQFPASRSPFFCSAIHPSDHSVLVGSRDSVWVLDPESGEKTNELIGFRSGVTTIVFNNDGSRFATVDDTVVYVWDADSLELISTLRGHQKMIKTVRFNPDSTRLFTHSQDETAGIWDIENEKLEALFQSGYDDRVIDADLSPDGTLVATGSEDGSVRIWQVDIWPKIDSRVSRRLTGQERKQYQLRNWTETVGERFALPPRMKPTRPGRSRNE